MCAFITYYFKIIVVLLKVGVANTKAHRVQLVYEQEKQKQVETHIETVQECRDHDS